MQDWISVKRLYGRGVKIKQIAKQLIMSKNTVKALLRSKEEPQYNRSIYKTKVDAFKDQIRLWYTEPEYDFIGTRIFSELKKIGYQGSMDPVYRYLKTLKEEKMKISSKATLRFETPMGDQAQFDWSEYKMVIAYEIRQVHCFSLVLAASRMKAIVFSLRVDGDAIYEAIQEMFEDLGGITREILIDNPKALVIENEPDKEPKYNLDALRLAAHLGTELNACNTYRAKTKGKVEKPFQDIKEHFVKANTFDSITQLNEMGKEFIKNGAKGFMGQPSVFRKKHIKKNYSG